jgi:hypothetical protein
MSRLLDALFDVLPAAVFFAVLAGPARLIVEVAAT